MTIFVDVIPSSPRPICWGDLKRKILNTVMDSEIQHLVGTAPRLIERQSKRSIDDAEALSLPGYYYFELARDNTLSLDVAPNHDEEGLSDYVDDFGRNLTRNQKNQFGRLGGERDVSCRCQVMADERKGNSTSWFILQTVSPT